MSTFKISLAIWSLGKTVSLEDLKKQLALAKEIGRRGIRGIDNAFFVTGAIQVTGKVSEEILKTLGVSPATAKELGREAGFISLFFIPAPHPLH